MIDVKDFENITLVCIDCQQTFSFEPGEQAFYLSKGLAQPKRCKPCRDARRATLIQGVR